MKRLLLAMTFMAYFLNLSVSASDFLYPELTVSPLASERLRFEAQREQGANFFANHRAIQISAFATLAAGLSQFSNTDRDSDSDRMAATTATAIGAGWLGLTMFFDRKYRPYHEGFKVARAAQVQGEGSQRALLARERYAEETMRSSARFGRRLDYLSAISNAGASLYLLSNSERETISKPLGVTALVASFAPLFFPNHWSNTYDNHESAKKRIFGPISFHPAIFEHRGQIANGMLLTASF